MSAADILSHYRQLAAAAAAPHATQRRAQERVQALPLPQRRDEDWRYTPLPPLLDTAFQPAEAEPDLLTAEDVASLRLTDPDSPCLVLHNGFYVPELSTLPSDGRVRVLPSQAALAAGDAIVQAHWGELSQDAPHLFSALNTALPSDGLCIEVAAGVQLARPIEVLHVTFSFNAQYLAQPRVLLVLGAGAQAQVVEHYAHLSDVMCLNNIVTEVFLYPQAQLQHARLQAESRLTRHLNSLYVQVGAGGSYHNTTLAFGGAWSRSEFHTRFAGEGAGCELNGFYLAAQQQAHDMHLNVVHNLPGCRSNSLFKGILQGQGKAVFDGNITVQPHAQQTDAHLNNANLVLSRTAEIDTKPRLEIYADDVQCSHGTTVGQLDPEMLFYLRARGIPLAQATRMVCNGFAGEVIATATVERLQAKAEQLLAAQL